MATATMKRERPVEKIPVHKHEDRLRQIKEHFARLFNVSTGLVQVHALYNSQGPRLSRYRVNHLATTEDVHFSTGFKIVQSYFVVIQDPSYSGSDEDVLARFKREAVTVVSTDPKLT